MKCKLKSFKICSKAVNSSEFIVKRKRISLNPCVGGSKRFGPILTLNISEILKDMKTHLVNSKNFLSQFLHGMFKDVQFEQVWSLQSPLSQDTNLA